MDRFMAANRDLWDGLTPIHARSAFYDVEDFKAGRSRLLSTEREEVGDVRGKSLLHLRPIRPRLHLLRRAGLAARPDPLGRSGRPLPQARGHLLHRRGPPLHVRLRHGARAGAGGAADQPAVLRRRGAPTLGG